MGAQFAKVWRETDGRVWVRTWYQDPSRSESVEMPIQPGELYLGVPYSKWADHLDEVIDLTTWEGTGEGMIGGPTRTLVEVILDHPLSFVSFTSEEEVLRAIGEVEDWLRDDRYEFTTEARNGLLHAIDHERETMVKRKELKAEFDLKHEDDREGR